jgi:signal transduction histidine kinase
MEREANWHWPSGPAGRSIAAFQSLHFAAAYAPESSSKANTNGVPMSQLMLASVNPSLGHAPAAQWAHDIRNALAITSLHLETLERLSGTGGRKAANAALAVMKRATGLCNASLAQARRTDQAGRRRGFDLIKTIKEVATILEPIVPDEFEIRMTAMATCMVMGDPTDVYRIVFNLVQNAIAVARSGRGMSHVGIDIAYDGPSVTVRISDDGPGLPKQIRAKLFRQQASTTGGNGLGIAIARELAERNGATLRLADCAKGTTYVLELVGARAMALVK